MTVRYVLYDPEHPLDWRVDDIDSIGALALITEKMYGPKATRYIDVKISIRDDGRYNTELILLDSKYARVFDSFCRMIIADTYAFRERPEDGAEYVFRTYRQWIDVFSGPRRLSEIAVKGLIGELLYIGRILIPAYGAKRAVEGWMLAKFGKQDFIIDDEWFEIKTTETGSDKVRISSVEQLDRTDRGKLCVVFLRKTSLSSSVKISLNSVYEEVAGMITDNATRELFTETLNSIGYEPSQDYDSQVYELDCMREYLVSDGFPCIHRSALNGAVSDVSYSILLSHLAKFEVKR